MSEKYNDDGNPFFPSNGSEGVVFERKNCDSCIKRWNCSIFNGAIDKDKHPKQWIYSHGYGVCTSFRDKTNRAKRKKAESNTGELL